MSSQTPIRRQVAIGSDENRTPDGIAAANVVPMAIPATPWLRCTRCSTLTHRPTAEATTTGALVCGSCGFPSVPVDLGAEHAARKRAASTEKPCT